MQVIRAIALAILAGHTLAADIVYTIERDGTPIAGAVYANGIEAGRAAERLAIMQPNAALAIVAFGRWEIAKVLPGPVDVRVSDKQSGENLVNPIPAIGATLQAGIIAFELVRGAYTFDRMEWWHGGQLKQVERSAPYTWHVDLGKQAPGPFTATVKVFNGQKLTSEFSVQITIAPKPISGKAKAALRWQGPTERENGKPLPATELAGYAVLHDHSGTRQRIAVTGVATTATLDLAQGLHALSVVAVDSDGLESEPSNTVEVTVP